MPGQERSYGAQSTQVMPGGELLDRGSHGGSGGGVEPGGQPSLEAG